MLIIKKYKWLTNLPEKYEIAQNLDRDQYLDRETAINTLKQAGGQVPLRTPTSYATDNCVFSISKTIENAYEKVKGLNKLKKLPELWQSNDSVK